MNANNYLAKKLIPRILRPVLLISVLIMAVSHSAFSQTANFKQTFTDAEYYVLMLDYKEALPLYLQLNKIDSANANVNFRLGECYLNIPGIKEKAIPYLERAVKNINPKYNEGSYKETQAPTIALFYLGEAYMVNHQLDKALDAFTQFKDRLDVKDVYNLDYVNQQINACKNAQNYLKNPIKIETERVTPFAERNKNCNYPVLSGDRKTMVFTVKEKFYSAIYYCAKEQEKWGNPMNITLDLTVEGEVYTTSLNHDGTSLLIFKNETNGGKIYHSNLVNGKWQPARKIAGGVASKDWETFASFTPDGKHLFFTSNRKGGQGGLDIYTAELMPGGNWSNIRNVADINTPYNEESPILANDGKTLYFASQGHSTMGGFDIFYSKLSDNGSWSTPINMGYPINTPDDEFYYFPIDSASALIPLVSKDLLTDYEIYKVAINPTPKVATVRIDGKITLSDNANFNSDNFTINIKDSKSLKLLASITPSSSTGEFSAQVKPGNYIVETVCNNYSASPTTVYIPDNYNQETYPLSLALTSNIVSQGLALKLNTILFDFDSYALTRDSKFELEKVYNLMETHPSLYIEVCGHTDSKGSASYNLKLSSKRAKSVVEYLTSKGIDERRFIVKGLGALSCIASNVNSDGSDNPAGRSLNRRASIRIFSGNSSIQIDNAAVPENLKPQNLTYTILLAKPGDVYTSEAVKEVEKALDEYSTRTDIGLSTYINIGSFASKSKAISTFNKIIDLNLPNATLVSEKELQRLIRAEQQNLVSTQTIFTILLMTSETPVSQSSFKGMMPTEEKGNDGFYRYYFGAFNSKEAAQLQLEKVNMLGFPNAMVVKFK